MILVAFVGLLVAVALPAWVKSRNAARARACVTNLHGIHTAKTQWAVEFNKSDNDVPTPSDITPYLRGNVMPTCPGAGVYRILKVSALPTCSFANVGHTLSEEAKIDIARE